MKQLESLANELLLDLFEYFNSIHLLQSFIGLNFRFNQLLYYHFQTHQFSLQSLSKENLKNIFDQHLPIIINKIISFHLSNDETPNLSELLLYHGFTFDRFIHLQSLSLYNIHSLDTLYNIIYQCQSLLYFTHLNIIKCDTNENQKNIIDLLNNIWSLSKLTHCNLNGIQSNERPLSKISKISSSIEYISIENISCNLNCLYHLFKYTPNLTRISTTLYSYSIDNYMTYIIPSIKSLKLFFGGCLDSMINLLKNLPNLSYLMIMTSQVYWDGQIWEELISNYIPNIKNFHLKMELEFRETNNDIDDIIDKLLISYQTHFWIEEHHWYIRCHWNPSNPYKWITLYTLPYVFNTFDYSNKCCSKSTCYDQGIYWLYNHVKIFDYGDAENTLFDNFGIIRARFPNIQYLQINLPLDDQFWLRFPSLNYLTSLNISLYNYSSYYQLQTLFNQALNLYSLKIKYFIGYLNKIFELKSKSIRRIDLIDILFDRSIYFTRETCEFLINSSLGQRCEVLLIRLKYRIDILYLIEKILNLRILIIECEDDKKDLIQWLQYYLPSTYSINRDPIKFSYIHIWISREIKKTLTVDNYNTTLKHKYGLNRMLTSFRQFFS